MILIFSLILSACNFGDKTDFSKVNWTESFNELVPSTQYAPAVVAPDPILFNENSATSVTFKFAKPQIQFVEFEYSSPALFRISINVEVGNITFDQELPSASGLESTTLATLSLVNGSNLVLPIPIYDTNKIRLRFTSDSDAQVRINIVDRQVLQMTNFADTLGCNDCHSLVKKQKNDPLRFYQAKCRLSASYTGTCREFNDFTVSHTNYRNTENVTPIRKLYSGYYLHVLGELLNDETKKLSLKEYPLTVSAEISELSDANTLAVFRFNTRNTPYDSDFLLNSDSTDGDADFYVISSTKADPVYLDSIAQRSSYRIIPLPYMDITVIATSIENAKYKISLRSIDPEPFSFTENYQDSIPSGCRSCHELKDFSRGPSWIDIARKFSRVSDAKSQLWSAYKQTNTINRPYDGAVYTNHPIDESAAYGVNRLFISLINYNPPPVSTGFRLTLESPIQSEFAGNELNAYEFEPPDNGYYTFRSGNSFVLNDHDSLPTRVYRWESNAKQFELITHLTNVDDVYAPPSKTYNLVKGEKYAVETFNPLKRVYLQVRKIQDPKFRASKVFSMLKNFGCDTCHQFNSGNVAPSWKDIFTRYQNEASALDQLFNSIRDGNSMNWTERAYTEKMGPAPDAMTDDDIKTVVWKLKNLSAPEAINLVEHGPSYAYSVYEILPKTTVVETRPGTPNRRLSLISYSGDADLYLFKKIDSIERELIGLSYSKHSIDEIEVSDRSNDVIQMLAFGFTGSNINTYIDEPPYPTPERRMLSALKCPVCHVFGDTVGTYPSIKQIATKYRNVAGAQEQVFTKLRPASTDWGHADLAKFSDAVLNEAISIILNWPIE